jgi:predicted phage gp36 major capsid-like protein
MSETPRTDAASRMAFSGEYMVPIEDAQKLERELTQYKEANAGLMRVCDNLERELAEEKAELKKYTTDSGDDSLYNVRRLRSELADITKQRDEAKRKRNEIFQALNKERQWMHEKMEAIRETMKEFNQWLK